MIFRRLFALSLLLGLSVSAFCSPHMVRADTITVNTLTDENDGSCTDGDCSLRDALAVAQAGDTIHFSVTGTIVVGWNLIIVRDVIIAGPGANSLTISGNNATRVIYILYGANASISGVTIAGGYGDWGGGIYLYEGSLAVTNCDFFGNAATIDGGGILNWGNVLTIRNSKFSGNSTSGEGGGIYNWAHSRLTVTDCTFIGNSASRGGGISSWDTLTATDTAFIENSAANQGGGICNSNAALTVTNCTFSGNSADEGGGISNWGTLTVTNSTFESNSASDDTATGGRGGGIENIGTATLRNTIIANSTSGGNCSRYSYFTGGSTNNLATDDTCDGFTQVPPAQLALGAPIGIPAYIPLNPGSVAIDAGTNNGCPAADQRGWPRPWDGNGDGTATCDVGSYEHAVLANSLYLPVILD